MTYQVFDYISGICLAQFRADVYRHLVEDEAVREEFVRAAIASELLLCYKTLREVLADGEPWLVSGNKLDIKDIISLVDYLFDAYLFAIR